MTSSSESLYTKVVAKLDRIRPARKYEILQDLQDYERGHQGVVAAKIPDPSIMLRKYFHPIRG